MKKLFKNIDLTKGSITKVLIAFALPILVSYLLQQVYVITDAAICGFYLNKDQVTGINSVNSLNFMVMQFAFGCTAGFSVVTANAIGKKDIDQSRRSLLCQMILSLIVSIFLTIASLFSLKLVLSFLGITKESNINIYNASLTYTGILYLGIVFQMFYNLGCCFLRSLGNSKTPLVFLLCSTILNVGLDLLFIAVIDMGVGGAALATIISQGVSAFACFTYIFIKFKEYRFRKDDFKTEKGFIFRHIKAGLPLGLQNSILAIGMIVMQAVLIKFDTSVEGVLGNDAQLGFTTACKIFSLLIQPYAALGTALISFTGQNFGAGEIKRVKSGVKIATLMGFILFIICGSIQLSLMINATYLRIFLSPDKINSHVIKYGNLYFYVTTPFSFLLMIIFLYRNVILALEKPLIPFIAGVLELLGRTLFSLFIPALINGGPINNLASDASYIAFVFSDVVSWAVAAIALSIGVVYFLKKSELKNNNKTNINQNN